MKTQAALRIQPTDLTDVARRYKALTAEIESLEKLVKPYRDTLEMAALETNGVIELSSYRISLTPIEREVFSIKRAREALGQTILRPFLRISKFNQLRVVEKKAA